LNDEAAFYFGGKMIAEPTMPKAYDPRQVEENLYDWWEQQGFFRPEQQIASGLADATRRPS
jgi:hypothetical protein